MLKGQYNRDFANYIMDLTIRYTIRELTNVTKRNEQHQFTQTHTPELDTIKIVSEDITQIMLDLKNAILSIGGQWNSTSFYDLQIQNGEEHYGAIAINK